MAYGKWISFELLVLAALCGCQANGPQKPFRLDSLGKSAGGNPSVAARSSSAKPGATAGVASKSSRPTAAGARPGAAVAPPGRVASADAVRAVARGSESPGSVSRASLTMQQAGQKVQRAFTPDPRKATPVDATSLSQNPGPLQPGLYVAAARMLEQRGDLAGALSKYEELLQADPTNLAGMVGQARIFHRREELDKAIEAYQRAMNTHGQDPVILNDLALCYARGGRKEEAIGALRAAVVSSPDSLLYRNNLAALLVETDREGEAVQVLEETHGPAIAHYNVGYLLFQRGLADKARIHFVTALQRDPNLRAAQVMLEKTAAASPAHLPVATTPPAAAASPASPPATVVPAPGNSVSTTNRVADANAAPRVENERRAPSALPTQIASPMPMPLSVLPASANYQASGVVHATGGSFPGNAVAPAILELPAHLKATSPQVEAAHAVATQVVEESTPGAASEATSAPVTPVDPSELTIRQPERIRAKSQSSLIAPLPN